MPGRPLVVVHRDKALLAEASAARLATAIVDAQAARGEADIVLTGGSMGSAILEALGRSPLRDAVDWGAVMIWWGDERFLPAGDQDRNETQARSALLDLLPLDPARVHPMAGSDQAGSPEEAAASYADQLAAAAGGGYSVPAFDVVMLGVGPDGHIASLFPGHPALSATGSTVGVHESPKPPPERVSLTFDALGRGVQVVVPRGRSGQGRRRRALPGRGSARRGAGRVGGRHIGDHLAARRGSRGPAPRLSRRRPVLTSRDRASSHVAVPGHWARYTFPDTICCSTHWGTARRPLALCAAHPLGHGIVSGRGVATPSVPGTPSRFDRCPTMSEDGPRGLRARPRRCVVRPVSGQPATYRIRPRWRRVARASSRMALPSASLRRSFT